MVVIMTLEDTLNATIVFLVAFNSLNLFLFSNYPDSDFIWVFQTIIGALASCKQILLNPFFGGFLHFFFSIVSFLTQAFRCLWQTILIRAQLLNNSSISALHRWHSLLYQISHSFCIFPIIPQIQQLTISCRLSVMLYRSQ